MKNAGVSFYKTISDKVGADLVNLLQEEVSKAK